jgi:hypothetical protein
LIRMTLPLGTGKGAAFVPPDYYHYTVRTQERLHLGSA